MTNRHRKGVIATMTALAAVAALAITGCASGTPGAAGSSGGAQGPITIANWGGIADQASASAYLQPFQAETGIQSQTVDAPGAFVARLEAQIKAGAVTWDLLDSMTGADAAYLESQGDLEKMPDDVHSRLVQLLGADNVTDYGYHSGGISMVIVCNTKTVAVCPANLQQYWDYKSYPGKRMQLAGSPIYGISAAEMAMGIPASQVNSTPIDADAVFAKLNELKPAISVFFQSADQGDQALIQGEADMGLFYTSRYYSDLPQDGTFKIVWTDGVLGNGTSVVPKGAPHAAEAWQLLEWVAAHPDAQAQFSLATLKTPVSDAGLAAIPQDKQQQFSNYPAYKGLLADPNVTDYQAKFTDLNQRWQEFIAG